MRGIIEYLKNNKALMDFYDEYGSQIRRMAAICLTGLVLFAGFSLFNSRNETPDIERSDTVSAQDASADNKSAAGEISDGDIYVDIGGAVKTPMLAQLPDGSRVDDAIKAAGGLLSDADMTTINRAEFLVDGQKIYIPSMTFDEEGNPVEGSVTDGAADASGKVNINTADSEQLQTLNGVGPATAQKILDYREANGSFSSAEDLKNVSGIGDKTYEKLKDNITI